MNQLTAETLVTGSETFGSGYEFDTQDRLKKITYPSGLIVNITPNAYGEPESVGSYASSIDYHVNGSIASLTYGTQQGTGRVYTTTQNARQLPDKLKVVLGANTIAELDHSYDPNANITAITDSVNGTSYNRSMGYDDIDRLETASGFWGSGSYSFDALGNLLTKTEGGQAMNYSYQSSTNRLTGITGTNPYSFSYDSYGNVTGNGSQGFTYNLAGNMTGSTSPSISYKYDGHKRRVQKTEGGQTSYTVYGQGGKLLHKKSGDIETDYIYAGSLLIAEKQGSTTHYLHTDLLGSPIAGDSGTAYAEHYRPWGEKKDHPTQLADDVGYTGHQDDVATGLTYMQARYYDPVVGRFYAVDPVGFTESNPMSFGRYLYVNSNPYKYKDPDGKWLVSVIVGAAFNASIEAYSQYKAGNGFDGKKLAIAAGSGAIAGLGAAKIAKGIASVATEIVQNTGIALNGTSRVLLSAGGNSLVGAATSGTQQAAFNNVDGVPLTEGVGEAALEGFVSGGLGGSAGEGVSIMAEGLEVATDAGVLSTAFRYASDIASNSVDALVDAIVDEEDH